ncbi:MAG: transporter substrate-binding protein [Clostridia bacterium]|jgi:peptide/nickel transport system substrate-binding protein|nr:transporter substrate-binding protein [Clostridia bacterium]
MKRYIVIFAIAVFGLTLLLFKNEPVISYLKDLFIKSPSYKRLVIGRANDAISLDPSITTESESFKVTANIYDTLVAYEKGGSELIPSLAESWKSSEDGLTWVFKLRKGVKFHDGTRFDAYAAAFNFERWMNSDSPYHTGHFSYWSYNFGGFPGIVKSVVALSDYSLEIILKKPYAPFLSTLATPPFGISSPEAIMKYNEKYSEHPIGTGPFKFQSWVREQTIILERNENYWKSKPNLNEIEFKVIPSNIDRVSQLEQGIIHMADNLTTDDLENIQNNPELKVYMKPFFNVGYLALNNTKEPLSKIEVRQAISHLINKEQLIDEVFNKYARPANTFIPPVIWVYHENIYDFEYNITEAKRLLEKAGFSNGFTIKLWVMDSPRVYFPKPMLLAEFIKESLSEGDINVEIERLKWDEYIERIKFGEHEMALMGWNGDNVDPDNFLYTLLASENAKPGLASNYAFYKNPEVDMLLTQARQVSDQAFRKSLYRKLQEIVKEDAPSIPLVHTMPLIGARKAVTGYVPQLTGEEAFEELDLIE